MKGKFFTFLLITLLSASTPAFAQTLVIFKNARSIEVDSVRYENGQCIYTKNGSKRSVPLALIEEIYVLNKGTIYPPQRPEPTETKDTKIINDTKKTYERNNRKKKSDDSSFFQMIMQVNDIASLQNKIGKAAAVENHQGVTIYLYDVPIKKSDRIRNPAIHFVDGKFNMVNYVSPEEMNQRIQMAKIRDKALSSPHKKGRTYNSAEIYSMTRGRTPEEMREMFGEPNKIWESNGKEAWTYIKLVVTSKGEIWDQNFLFDFGRVYYDWVEKSK